MFISVLYLARFVDVLEEVILDHSNHELQDLTFFLHEFSRLNHSASYIIIVMNIFIQNVINNFFLVKMFICQFSLSVNL